MMTFSRIRQRHLGQASIEYVVVCAALATALFVPIRDTASPDEARSAIQIIFESFQTAYERISYAISLPY